jgi:hypothetical protein
MKLFLQLDLTPWQEADYQRPLLTYASSLSSDLIGAELDNQSEASISDIILRLCDQMTSIFIFIHAKPNEPFGATLKLLNTLLRTNQKIYAVVLSGNHEQAENLFKHLNDKFKKEDNPEKVKIWIEKFALA